METIAEDFQREIEDLIDDHEPVITVVNRAQGWQIMAALQLASRHPDMPQSIRETAAWFARSLQGRIATTPALRRVAEQGWHQENAE